MLVVCFSLFESLMHMFRFFVFVIISLYIFFGYVIRVCDLCAVVFGIPFIFSLDIAVIYSFSVCEFSLISICCLNLQ